MVITREHVEAAGPGLLSTDTAPIDTGLTRAASVRECARLAALQLELKSLGSTPTSRAGLSAPEYAAVGLRGPTIRMSERDARYRMPTARLRDLLASFGSALDTPANAPRALVVVAHQDDESIGAGAQLARLDDVTVVHVTNGAPASDAYAQRFGFASSHEYGEARRREAERALELVGVPKERQLCLGVPDGQASYNLTELSLTVAELIDGLRPELLITHPYEGGHTDHDAIAFAVHLACGILRREGVPVPALVELTSYHNWNGQRAVHRFLPYEGSGPLRTVNLSPEARALKARLYDCFTTQQRCLSSFSVGLERFRAAPRYDFTRPPHEGQLDYERLSRNLSGEAWRAEARKALAQLRTRPRGHVSLVEPRTRTSATEPTRILEVA